MYFPPEKEDAGKGNKKRFLGLRMKKNHVEILSEIVKWCPIEYTYIYQVLDIYKCSFKGYLFLFHGVASLTH